MLCDCVLVIDDTIYDNDGDGYGGGGGGGDGNTTLWW